MKKHLFNTFTATTQLATSDFAATNEYTDVSHFGIHVLVDYGLLKVNGDERFDDDTAHTVFIGRQNNPTLSIEGVCVDLACFGS